MIINCNQLLKAVDGTILARNQTPLELKTVLCEALMASYKEEQDLGGDEKHKRFKLSQKIFRSKEPINISAEEIVIIKRLVGLIYSPAIVGPVFDLLEGIVDEYSPEASE